MQTRKHPGRWFNPVWVFVAVVVAMVDLAAAQEIKPTRTLTLAAPLETAVFSADGARLITKGPDGVARVWDATSGALVTSFPVAGAVIAISPNGVWLAAAGAQNTARVIDVAAGREIATLTGHADEVTALAFSPDGQALLTGSKDRTAKLWDVATGAVLMTFVGHDRPVTWVGFRPNGERLVTITGDHLLTFTPASKDWRRKVDFGMTIAAATFRPDGARLVVGTAEGHVVPFSGTLDGPSDTPFRPHETPVTAVAVSPDGRAVVSGARDGTMQLTTMADGRPRARLAAHRGPVLALHVSADGATVRTVSADRTLRIYSLSQPDTVAAAAPDFGTNITGLWQQRDDAAPAAFAREVCKMMPIYIHRDGLIAIFQDQDERKLPVMSQHIQCDGNRSCASFEGPPPATKPSDLKLTLSVSGRYLKLCEPGGCNELMRCPSRAWTKEETSSGYAKAWEERVQAR
jgi:dipeptidyl aminopeptidase/acylaminoacyl peptidase